MIVVSITDCPAALRGDLTKWLFEVNVGVYVGQVSARVRDELWNRIVDNCKVGRVTMVYQTNNEQHFAFRVHNSAWKPIDFDGLTLMLRPIDEYSNRTPSLRPGFSKAAQRQIVKRIQRAEERRLKRENEGNNIINSASDSAKLPLSKNDKLDESPLQEVTHSISTTQLIHTQHNDKTQQAQEEISPLNVESEHSINTLQNDAITTKPSRKSSRSTTSQTDPLTNKRIPKQRNPQTKQLALSFDTPAQYKQIKRYVVIDLETTGLDENKHEIIEFGAIRIIDGQINDKFQCLVKIENNIPAFITKLTGITQSMTDELGISLYHALNQFIQFIGNDFLIAHNIEFDMKFIQNALHRYQLDSLSNKTICTLELARLKHPGASSYKLKSLIDNYNIESSGEHRSLADCESVFKLFEILRR